MNGKRIVSAVRQWGGKSIDVGLFSSSENNYISFMLFTGEKFK